MAIKFAREWGMPSADTFDCPPIAAFVKRYLAAARVSVDPFARNKQWATFTNDINPSTLAENHMDAELFLRGILPDSCDMAILDPPYSPRQISEAYAEAGRRATQKDTQNSVLYKRVRDALMPCLTPDAIVLSFGWNSVGMGKKRGFEIIEVLLVCHGGAHNDTICIAEKRMPQAGLDNA